MSVRTTFDALSLAKAPRGKFGVASRESRTLDGTVFDSKAEMDRWSTLKMMERSGLIHSLDRQVPFELQAAFVYQGKTERAIVYVADFTYFRKGEYRPVVEDLKGAVTDVYAIKRKLFLARYGDQYEFYENRLKGRWGK